MLKLVGALLVGILSASLAVIYQNDIAAFLGRAPIAARITAGAWYPHPEPNEESGFSQADEEHIQSFSNPKEESFARLVISNNTARDIDNAVVRIGDSEADIWRYDAVVLSKRDGKAIRRSIADADDRIEIGQLPAAQNTVVYLWTDRGFDYPWRLSDIEVLTTDGGVPTSLTNIRGSSYDVFLGISTEMIAWFFVFLLILLCAILVFVANHGFSFSKAMLKDEDYYLTQRVRFDSDPAKFSVPDTLPKA